MVVARMKASTTNIISLSRYLKKQLVSLYVTADSQPRTRKDDVATNKKRNFKMLANTLIYTYLSTILLKRHVRIHIVQHADFSLLRSELYINELYYDKLFTSSGILSSNPSNGKCQ